VIERRKGSVHDDSKLHKMDTIAEDGSANGQGAVAIEMGSAATSAPSGESKRLRGALTSSANRHYFLTPGPSEFASTDLMTGAFEADCGTLLISGPSSSLLAEDWNILLRKCAIFFLVSS
jgi:hypothetical protein